MNEVKVISLGGSIIIPQDKKDVFMKQFRDVLKRHYAQQKFVLVCGGGSIARAYQHLLKEEHQNYKQLSLAGIRATRTNAETVMQMFGKESNAELPLSMKKVKSELHKNNVVICGSLRYASNETSDSTAAKLADYLKAEFINVTNVAGLYPHDPKKNPRAKLISYQTWIEFEKRAKAIRYKPGQHFVLDQKAAQRIRKKKIKTYIVGKNANNLDLLLRGKKFKGTTIGP